MDDDLIDLNSGDVINPMTDVNDLVTPKVEMESPKSDKPEFLVTNGGFGEKAQRDSNEIPISTMKQTEKTG